MRHLRASGDAEANLLHANTLVERMGGVSIVEGSVERCLAIRFLVLLSSDANEIDPELPADGTTFDFIFGPAFLLLVCPPGSGRRPSRSRIFANLYRLFVRKLTLTSQRACLQLVEQRCRLLAPLVLRTAIVDLPALAAAYARFCDVTEANTFRPDQAAPTTLVSALLRIPSLRIIRQTRRVEVFLCRHPLRQHHHPASAVATPTTRPSARVPRIRPTRTPGRKRRAAALSRH